VVVLVTLNVWRAATGDVGPDPEAEALHSEKEAARVFATRSNLDWWPGIPRSWAPRVSAGSGVRCAVGGRA